MNNVLNHWSVISDETLDLFATFKLFYMLFLAMCHTGVRRLVVLLIVFQLPTNTLKHMFDMSPERKKSILSCIYALWCCGMGWDWCVGREAGVINWEKGNVCIVNAIWQGTLSSVSRISEVLMASQELMRKYLALMIRFTRWSPISNYLLCL